MEWGGRFKREGTYVYLCGSVTLVMLKPGLPLQDWLLRMGAGTSTLARVGPERTWEECSSVCVIGGSSGVERRGDDLTNVCET